MRRLVADLAVGKLTIIPTVLATFVCTVNKVPRGH